MSKIKYQVLLYYRYVELKYPKRFMKEQRSLCEKLSLKGRIIIATEGINGTVEGSSKNTQKYINAMHSDKRFKDMDFKISEGTGDAFPKLSVKVRDELVSSYLESLNPNKLTGKYISADELHEWFETGKEFYMVDMRNDYEYISGAFEGSIFSDFSNFRDLPKILKKLKPLKNKTIVTCCTGGIRCEKASGFLVENGFSDVYQIKNGIQTYMQKYPNKHFKGKLYVFDGRITLGFNTDSPEHQIISNCDLCGVKCDSYVNCANNLCHRHFIACINCRDSETESYFCDDDCLKMANLPVFC